MRHCFVKEKKKRIKQNLSFEGCRAGPALYDRGWGTLGCAMNPHRHCHHLPASSAATGIPCFPSSRVGYGTSWGAGRGCAAYRKRLCKKCVPCTACLWERKLLAGVLHGEVSCCCVIRRMAAVLSRAGWLAVAAAAGSPSDWLIRWSCKSGLECPPWPLPVQIHAGEKYSCAVGEVSPTLLWGSLDKCGLQLVREPLRLRPPPWSHATAPGVRESTVPSWVTKGWQVSLVWHTRRHRRMGEAGSKPWLKVSQNFTATAMPCYPWEGAL